MVPYLNIPFLAVGLFLLAGILIGHMIWYRDRTDDESTLLELRGENSDLQAALYSHKQAYVDLEGELEDRRKEWDQLKGMQRQMEQAKLDSDRQQLELIEEITRLQQLKDQAFHDLDHERQQRRALQESIASSEMSLKQEASLVEQLRSEMSSLQAQLKLRNDSLQDDLAARTQEVDVLRAELSEIHTRHSQLTEAAAAEQNQLRIELAGAIRARDSVSRDLHELTLVKEQTEDVERIREFADRKQQEAEQQAKMANAERDHLSQALEVATQRLNDLISERDAARVLVDRHLAEKNQWEHRAVELSASCDRLTQELHRREEDLHSVRQERDSFAEFVEDERTIREQWQQQVQQVDLLVTLRDNALEMVAAKELELAALNARLATHDEQLAWREEYLGLEKQHHELTTVLESLQAMHTQSVAEHTATAQRLASLEQEYQTVTAILAEERSRGSQIESENHRLSIATQQFESVSENMTRLKAEFDARGIDVERLRAELEETAAKLGRERHQREHLQEVVDKRNAEVMSLTRSRADLQELVDTMSTQNRALSEQAAVLSSLRGEHESVKRMLDEKSQQWTAVRTEYEQQQAIQQHTARKLQELEQEVKDLESERRQQNTEYESLQERLTALAALKQSYGEQHERLEKVVAQRDEILKAHANTQAEAAALREQLAKQENSFGEMGLRYEQLQGLRDAEAGQLAAAQESIHNQLRDLQELRAKYQEVSQAYDLMQRDHLALQTKMTETADRLQRVSAERDDRRAAALELERRVGQLEAKSRASEETIRILRRERAAVLARSKPGVIAAPRSVLEDETGGRMRRDDLLGNVYTQPPKRKDDLKRISGIAQVLEKKLNAFGVYTYQQIMEWDNVAIEEFSKLLSFRDRIVRDDWVGQARSLHFDRYGRAA